MITRNYGQCKYLRIKILQMQQIFVNWCYYYWIFSSALPFPHFGLCYSRRAEVPLGQWALKLILVLPSRAQQAKSFSAQTLEACTSLGQLVGKEFPVSAGEQLVPLVSLHILHWKVLVHLDPTMISFLLVHLLVCQQWPYFVSYK